VGDDLDTALTDAGAALWRAYLAHLPSDHPHRATRVTAFSFADSPGLADELAALVVSGRKRATASLPIQFEAEGAALPVAGDVSIVTRADGTPLAIIETTDVRLVPFGDVQTRSSRPPKAKATAPSLTGAVLTRHSSVACSPASTVVSTTARSSSASAFGCCAATMGGRSPTIDKTPRERSRPRRGRRGMAH